MVKANNKHQYQTYADTKQDLVELFGASIYFVLATIVLPQLALFFGGAIEESINFDKFVFYVPALTTVMAFITLIKFINVIAHQIKWDFEIPFFLHDPELSPLRNAPKFLTDPRFIILAMILIGSINTLAGISQTSLPVFEQQVTETAQVTFAIYPASPSETMLMVTLLCVVILMPHYYLWRKLKYPFMIFAILNIILFTIGGGLYGYFLHFYRYGASETALQSVVTFWSISGFLTASTGSCIPAIIQHDMNNGILSAKQLFSSQTVSTVFTLLLGIVILLMAVFIVIYRKEQQENKQEDSHVET